MRRFTFVWAALAILALGVEAAAARTSATALWNNVVCMSLPIYILSLLLPAEDVVTVIGRKIGLEATPEQ